MCLPPLIALYHFRLFTFGYSRNIFVLLPPSKKSCPQHSVFTFLQKDPQSFKPVTNNSIFFLRAPQSPAPRSHPRLPTCAAARLDLRRDEHQRRPARDQHQCRRLQPAWTCADASTCGARCEGNLRRRPPRAAPPAPLNLAATVAHLRCPRYPTCATTFAAHCHKPAPPTSSASAAGAADNSGHSCL